MAIIPAAIAAKPIIGATLTTASGTRSTLRATLLTLLALLTLLSLLTLLALLSLLSLLTLLALLSALALLTLLLSLLSLLLPSLLPLRIAIAPGRILIQTTSQRIDVVGELARPIKRLFGVVARLARALLRLTAGVRKDC